jgi:hypothetical protein
MTLRARTSFAFLGAVLCVAGLTACDDSTPVDGDAGPGGGGTLDVPRICDDMSTDITTLTAVDGDTVTVSLDTAAVTIEPRDLGLACGNTSGDVRWAPQSVIALEMPGTTTDRFAVRVDTDFEETQADFRVVLQARTSCDAVPTADDIANSCIQSLFNPNTGEVLLANGAFSVNGGQTVFLFVTGFSRDVGDPWQDRGSVRLDIGVERNSRPDIRIARWLNFPGAQPPQVAIEGTDPEGNLTGVFYQFTAGGVPLDLINPLLTNPVAGGLPVTTWLVDAEIPATPAFNIVEELAGPIPQCVIPDLGDVWFTPPAPTVNEFIDIFGGQIDGVRLIVVDEFGEQDFIDIGFQDGTIGESGDSCVDPVVLCRPPLQCVEDEADPSMAFCRTGMMANTLCENPETLEDEGLTYDPELTTFLGLPDESLTQIRGFFSAPDCTEGGPARAAGLENVYAFTLPEGPGYRFSATTDVPDAPIVNTIMYLRGDCTDEASQLACNDDVVGTRFSTISDIELAGGEDYFLVVEENISESELPPSARSQDFGLNLTFTPIRAAGQTCEVGQNVCATGTSCVEGTCQAG